MKTTKALFFELMYDFGSERWNEFELQKLSLRELVTLMVGTFIIALSGYGTEQDRERAYEAGFNYHLTKPVAPATLFEFLSRTLEPPS
jgi:DNA-binding NarL/FixJ family response regulator